MAVYDAGTARAVYELDLAPLRASVAEAKRLYEGLARTTLPQPTIPRATPPQPRQPAAPKVPDPAIEAARAEAAILRQARAEANLAVAQNRHANAANILDTALGKVNRTSVAAINTQTQLERITARLGANASGAAGRLQVLPRTIAGFSNEAAQFVTGAIGIGSALALVTKGAELAQIGAQAQAARQSFDSLARSAQTSGSALLGSLRAAVAGTASDAKLIQSSNTALLLLGDTAATKLPQLLSIARASAKTLGADTATIFDNLVTGIARGSTELLDNAGIVVKAGEAQAKYAATLGKSAEALTSAEKQQAILNAVLTSGQDILTRVGNGAESNAERFNRLGASADNLKVTLGTGFAKASGPIVGAIADIVQAASDGITQLDAFTIKAAQFQGRSLVGTTDYTQYSAQIGDLNRQVGILGPKTQVLTKAQFEYTQSLIASGVAGQEAYTRSAQLTDVTARYYAALQTAVQKGEAQQDAFAALAPQILRVAEAGGEGARQLDSLLLAYQNGERSTLQFALSLDGLEQANTRAALAAQETARETNRANTTLQTAEQVARASAAAFNADALAKVAQAAQTDVVQARQAQLASALERAAASSLSAEAAAQRLSQIYVGTQVPALIEVINKLREKNALEGAPIAKGYGGGVPADVKRAQDIAKQTQYRVLLQQELVQATGTTAQKLEEVNRKLRTAIPFSEEARRLEVEKAQLLKQQAAEREAAAKKAASATKKDVTAAEREANQILDYQQQIEDRTAQHYRTLRNLQSDYELSSRRNTEDYQRQRQRLLAEGRIFEAQQLQETFAIEQRRAAEDAQRARAKQQEDYAADIARANREAAQKGILGGATVAPATIASGQAQNAAQQQAQAVLASTAALAPIQLRISFAPTAVQIDKHTVFTAIWPDVEQAIDASLAESVINVSVTAPPAGGQGQGVGGPRP